MTETIQLSVCSYCGRRQYERQPKQFLDGTHIAYPCPDCGSRSPDGRVVCRWHGIGVIFHRQFDDQWCWAWRPGRIIPCGTKEQALAYSRTVPDKDF